HLEIAVAVEVGRGGGRVGWPGHRGGPQQVALVVEQLVAGQDLHVAVVVHVGQGDRADGVVLPHAGALPLERAVVLERHWVAAGAGGDDLGQPVAVDVAERGGDREVDEIGNREVQRPGGAVEHVDVGG